MSSEEGKLSVDSVVKQESSDNDKNPSSAQTPAKPAQEQTRTENLQRIQQRKLKVIYFAKNFIEIQTLIVYFFP